MTEQVVQGTSASPGIAIGPVFKYRPLVLMPPNREASNFDSEMARFQAARKRARTELDALQTQASQRVGDETAEIFGAHKVLLADPMLEEGVRERVASGSTVEAAVSAAVQHLEEMLTGTGDALLASRADDVKDIGQRILRILLDVADTSFSALASPAIITAEDLTPSNTVSLEPRLALGICLAGGSSTSHAAILARTLGIPAIIGIGSRVIDELQPGQMIAMDGFSGEIVVNPTVHTSTRYHRIRQSFGERNAEINRVAHELAFTLDGRRIAVAANIGRAEFTAKAVELGAEGIGLMRTEMLFFNTPTAPDEGQQTQRYREVFEAMGDRPITVRTWDFGGDKPPDFMEFPVENNPFLGWRGIRVSLDHPEQLKTQLRAILSAAVGHHIRIMYPMVESLDTLHQANAIYAEVRAELDRARVPYPRGIPVGIMVETPSAAIMADVLATESDFFSIGTNDLTQYTLAADRNDGRVARYYRGLSPAVLRLIQMTVRAAHKQGKPVSICGELAGQVAAIPILLGMGLENLSMIPAAIPQAKWLIRQLTLEDAQYIAEQALTLSNASEIEAYVNAELRERDLL